MTKSYTRYHSGEWSALYEDGKLVVVGDHYLADDYLSNVLGVVDVYNDDFLTEDQRGALPTLEAVKARTQARESALVTAQAFREQAEELIRQAEEIEKNA